MPDDPRPDGIEPILIRFVVEEILYDQEAPEVDVDDPLLGHVLDSVDVLNLVDFLERRFDIRIGDDEVVPESFETLRAVAALVNRKRSAQG